MTDMPKKGERVTMSGSPNEWRVLWSSDEMTDEERYQSHLRTAEFLEAHGMSGAWQRIAAERYRDSDGSGEAVET